ncbi:D-2-hydroxyacid dehydrogenase [Celerinatantimonas sp. YJH-8]|uniref:D-2-hydroxyacid dehydrogenase n=1 Tax=Celerinatantimonas sp. YJH-8 TaxID=3228714 RepID=UPI0038C6B056
MATVVCLERDSLGAQFQLPPLSAPHEWRNYPTTLPEQIVVRLRDADIAVVNKIILNEKILAQLPKLKLIAVSATGFNNIDVSAANRMGIQVCNIQNYAGIGVAEHIFMLILALRRNLIKYRQKVQTNYWQQCGQFCFTDFPIDNLHGQTLGIIGAGDLGQHVAKLAQAFGMKIQFAAREGQPADGHKVEFQNVLQTSDILVVSCPLNEQTRNLIAREQFAQMKSNALLINAARGGIVNEQALLDALTEQQIAGAGFDVSDNEPPKEDSPLMQAAQLDNCILTPHIAWAATESRETLIAQLIENIQGFLDGHPRHIITI